MKVPDTDFDIKLRYNEPPGKIEFTAHAGVCNYCKGIVKMFRDQITFKLQPDDCRCLVCGQPYFVEVVGTIEDWEQNQWVQKGQTFVMDGD